VGALTAIDGALILNRSLALIAFGAILRVGRAAMIREALDAEGTRHRAIDFGAAARVIAQRRPTRPTTRERWCSSRPRMGRYHACFAITCIDMSCSGASGRLTATACNRSAQSRESSLVSPGLAAEQLCVHHRRIQ
jgi:hypothetical protein